MRSLGDFRGRALPLVRQSEAAECGLACLAMLTAYHGRDIDLGTLRRRHPISLGGATLKALVDVAGHLGLACRPLRFELHQLRDLRLPAILHWDMNHFVVLKAATSNGVVVHDPAAGVRRLTLEEASRHVTGVALEALPTAAFEPKPERSRLPLRTFWGQVKGTHHALLQVFVLSLVLEVLVVLGPLFMQLTIDEVLIKGDTDFLFVLATGFGLLALVSVGASALRATILVLLQNTLAMSAGINLFRHLVRLPMTFFEKRHVGDVLSRFGSTEPIQRHLAEGLVASVIDGLMAGATLVMILLLSPLLAGVVLAALAVYALLRLALFAEFRRRSEDLIGAKAKESTVLIEAVRAIQGVKLANREVEVETRWLNRFAESANANVRLGRLNVAFKTLNEAVFAIENVVVVYIAARLALDGAMSIGMVFAFMSYKQNFIARAVGLVEKGLEFKTLDLHLERLSDIALTPQEPGAERKLAYGRPIRGGLELRGLGFRYAPNEPLVFEGLNLRVEPGQSLAIAGPSGSGKSTLIKVMLGLIEPSEGELLIDGFPLTTLGPQAYREHVAAVMQDDQLISGSIADNICFLDDGFDMAWMVACARAACVHDEIMAMPMAYNSLIGDMGSALSGGQKQRVLLARALYRRPKILVLDEGTAHLDLDLERRINETLGCLSITRISVAHRPETLKAADRIFHMRPVPLEAAGGRSHAASV